MTGSFAGKPRRCLERRDERERERPLGSGPASSERQAHEEAEPGGLGLTALGEPLGTLEGVRVGRRLGA